VNGYLLAIDTTGEFGSIALIEGERVLEEIPLHSPDGFGHVLFHHLQRLLDNHELTVADLACFAAASGPGSFTGVRVGLAAVKGLAEAAGKPAIGVSNLRAVASFGERAVRAAVLDARRGEVYGGMYDSQSDPLGPEVVAKAGVWAASLPAEAEIVSTDPALFAAALPGRNLIQAPRALAGAIGRIAWRDWRAGKAADPAALDANYVRRSDAELFWKEG